MSESKYRKMARKLWDDVLPHTFEPYDKLEAVLLRVRRETIEECLNALLTRREFGDGENTPYKNLIRSVLALPGGE